MKGQSILIILISISSVHLQQFEYLRNENDECMLSDNPVTLGACVKAKDCRGHFEKYKKKLVDLKICKFDLSPEDSVICCPKSDAPAVKLADSKNEQFLDFETCRERYISVQKGKRSYADLITDRLKNENFTLTSAQCESVRQHRSDDDNFYGCKVVGEGEFLLTISSLEIAGTLTRVGDWPNMAALGWTKADGKVNYNCGGVIINERFVITAAHCRFEGKAPDTLRLGDRFLLTTQDDKNAQQVAVEKFIIHPNYRSSQTYDDIAVIMTKEKILFNRFVAPACIPEKVEQKDAHRLYSAGYGEVKQMALL
jgi:hypothetical protein